MSGILVNKMEFIPYISQREINIFLNRTAQLINDDYKNSDGLHLIIILNGAYKCC